MRHAIYCPLEQNLQDLMKEPYLTQKTDWFRLVRDRAEPISNQTFSDLLSVLKICSSRSFCQKCYFWQKDRDENIISDRKIETNIFFCKNDPYHKIWSRKNFWCVVSHESNFNGTPFLFSSALFLFVCLPSHGYLPYSPTHLSVAHHMQRIIRQNGRKKSSTRRFLACGTQ